MKKKHHTYCYDLFLKAGIIFSSYANKSLKSTIAMYNFDYNPWRIHFHNSIEWCGKWYYTIDCSCINLNWVEPNIYLSNFEIIFQIIVGDFVMGSSRFSLFLTNIFCRFNFFYENCLCLSVSYWIRDPLPSELTDAIKKVLENLHKITWLFALNQQILLPLSKHSLFN